MTYVRVLRVLEYIGESDDVMADLEKRYIKGSYTNGKVTIREGIIGEYPEILIKGASNGTQD
jgi:hypothetical protein